MAGTGSSGQQRQMATSPMSICEEDASVGALEAVSRLEASLLECSSKREEESRAMLSLGVASRLLLEPRSGRRYMSVLEGAARVSARACGVLKSGLGAEAATRLLGGVALRLPEGSEEARGSLLETGRLVFEKCEYSAWLVLNDGRRGRPIVAAVAKAACDAARDESERRQNRERAFGVVLGAVEATPDHIKGDLWRCFLPGLFSPCYVVSAQPSWSPRDGGLRSHALDAASALVSAAVMMSSPTKRIEGGVAVERSEEWVEQTRQRLLAYLPAMLASCRRDPSERTRLSAARAAARLYSTKFFDDDSIFLADTLSALRFDDESTEVARVATTSLRDVDVVVSLQAARTSATRVVSAARSGDERALVDALNTMRFASYPDSVDAALEALSIAFELESGSLSRNARPIEAPLKPPTYLDTSELAKARAARASRLGAAFHRPTFRWLRLPRSRDAARRACWLLALSQNKTLVIDRQLARLEEYRNKACDAIVLAEILEAVAGAAFVLHEHEIVELDEDSTTNTELITVADFVARRALEALRTTANDTAAQLADDDPSTSLHHEYEESYLRDGSVVASSPKQQKKLLAATSGGTEEELAPALCRVLALSCELAVVGGGSRGARRALRQVLYPLLERLADPDPTTRQAALGSLVTIAGFEEEEEELDAKSDALAELLSKNMDYVVEAACRKMRRAKTATDAARAAAVVEALLRHSRCSLATPLLRDVVENALRDIDEHRLDGAEHAYAFARLMRAMLSTLPEEPSDGDDDDDDDGKKAEEEASAAAAAEVDWLQPCVDAIEQPMVDAQDRMIAEALSAAQESVGREESHAVADDDAESKKRNETVSERVYRKSLEEQKRWKNDADMKKETPEEDLVKRVLKRAIYFVAPKFDFQTRRVALEVVADGVLRLRGNEKQVRPLVHKVWPAIHSRLKVASPDDLDNADFANCLAASLDVVAAFVYAVGDFMSYKFNDDLWPSLRVVLSSHTSSKRADRVPKAHRRRAFQAALNCLRAFSDHPDCASFVRPAATFAARLSLDHVRHAALIAIEAKENFDIPPALPDLLKSLAIHDPDGLWLLVSTELASRHTAIETDISSTWPCNPPLPCLPRWSLPSRTASADDSPLNTLLAPFLVDAYKYLEENHQGRIAAVTLW